MTDYDIEIRIKELENLIQQAEARLEDHEFDVFLIEFVRKWKAELLALVRKKERAEARRQRVIRELSETKQHEAVPKKLIIRNDPSTTGAFFIGFAMGAAATLIFWIASLGAV